MIDPFATFTSADVKALIVQYPLAWVCSTGDAPMEAAQLPLVGEYDDDGRLQALIGHLGRRNPLCDRLRLRGTATVLFSGPEAYVSPDHAGLRDWAPTWNHANLRITADVTVDAGLTEEALDTLIRAMETGRATPWTRDAIMHRYAGMAEAIIGFRATVTGIAGRFKLGQDEGEAVYRNILDRHPDADLTEWMRRLNPSR